MLDALGRRSTLSGERVRSGVPLEGRREARARRRRRALRFETLHLYIIYIYIYILVHIHILIYNVYILQCLCDNTTASVACAAPLW